jgi:hypothetical protein
LRSLLAQASHAANAFLERAIASVGALITLDGRLNLRALDRAQLAKSPTSMFYLLESLVLEYAQQFGAIIA